MASIYVRTRGRRRTFRKTLQDVSRMNVQRLRPTDLAAFINITITVWELYPTHERNRRQE